MRFATRMAGVSASPIMELIKTVASGEYISFASGLPDSALYPVETLAELADLVLTRDGRAALQYGAAEGYMPLRAQVAERLTHRGLRSVAENILITSGSQQAIDLVARALLDPGDVVAVERPTYLAALQVFSSYGAALTECLAPNDGGGPCTWQPATRLLYCMPNFQNPAGSTWTLERRQTVAAAATTAGLPVLEDDAYGDLRYEGEDLPAVAACAHNPAAIYTGTFSKVICPGVRVGYLRADAGLVERLTQLKQITDLHTGSLTQRIVAAYCEHGLLDPGIERYRSVYTARRDILLQALQTHCPSLQLWTRPRGGMFVFLTHPERGADGLLQAAMAVGVVFVPGRSFFAHGGGERTLRLNFVSEPEAQIIEGARLLGSVL